MKNLLKATLLSTALILCLNAQENNLGENIFNNDKDKNVNNYVDTNIKVGTASKDQESVQDTSYQNNAQYQNYSMNYNQNQQEMSKEELELLRASIRNQNLNALQQKFFNKKYSGYENTKKLNYEENKTQKIRTRFAMATTLIFNNEIESFILGDTSGFMVQEVPDKPNTIAIKPLLIGIDTSLTIFTKDKKLHTFYVYSTDYKSNNDPSLVIYIDDKNINEKEQDINDDNYLIIKDGITEMKVLKKDIYNKYTQKAPKDSEWLLSAEIFNDKKFTYFKYDKDEMPQIPTIFAVIDNQDSPAETRVIGNYIIAETTNAKFTIKSGKSYVCVERVQTQEEKQRIKERQLLNTNSKEYKKALKEKETKGKAK